MKYTESVWVVHELKDGVPVSCKCHNCKKIIPFERSTDKFCSECGCSMHYLDLNACGDNYVDTLEDLFSMTDELPDKYRSALRKAIDTLSTTTTFSRWIPVTESLPDTPKQVLVTVRYKCLDTFVEDINKASYENGKWLGCGIINDVIAWQPMPDTYHLEGEDNG
jgi:hypothetical protein